MSMEISSHSFSSAGQTFELPTRYGLIRSVGSGAYGVVISCTDSETGCKVAIKKIPRAFEDVADAKRILREITLLRQFEHDNIVSVVNIVPPVDHEWSDLYIVSELMETDLHRIIYSKQDLSVEHAQYFVYQVLRALKYMHSANVVHRDLKPSNLLVNSNCDLKICDLGLARGVEPDGRPGELTEYVVTRWYRAPEIMLACQEYTKAIDLWSTGCIFAELLERKAIFPGDDYIDQIRKICSKLGRPALADLDFVTSEKAKRFIVDLDLAGGGDTPDLDSSFSDDTDPSALDLLREMLVFNPRQRCSVDDALQHEFMSSLHDEEDEPTADFTCAFDFELQELDRTTVRQLVWDEMLHYNARLRPPEPPQSRVTQSPPPMMQSLEQCCLPQHLLQQMQHHQGGDQKMQMVPVHLPGQPPQFIPFQQAQQMQQQMLQFQQQQLMQFQLAQQQHSHSQPTQAAAGPNAPASSNMLPAGMQGGLMMQPGMVPMSPQQLVWIQQQQQQQQQLMQQMAAAAHHQQQQLGRHAQQPMPPAGMMMSPMMQFTAPGSVPMAMLGAHPHPPNMQLLPPGNMMQPSATPMETK